MDVKLFDTPALYADHHVTEVRRILLELNGVTDVYASSAFQTVEVTFDNSKVSESEIAAKLSAAGYLGDWVMPAETNEAVQQGENNQRPYFRHSTAYETVKKTVSFAQQVDYKGRVLWPCPGFGMVSVGQDKEAEHA